MYMIHITMNNLVNIIKKILTVYLKKSNGFFIYCIAITLILCMIYEKVNLFCALKEEKVYVFLMLFIGPLIAELVRKK